MMHGGAPPSMQRRRTQGYDETATSRCHFYLVQQCSHITHMYMAVPSTAWCSVLIYLLIVCLPQQISPEILDLSRTSLQS